MGQTLSLYKDIEIDTPLEKSIVTYSYPARGAIAMEHGYVIKAIAKKEVKIVSYKDKYHDIKEFWLCVNIERNRYGAIWLHFAVRAKDNRRKVMFINA